MSLLAGTFQTNECGANNFGANALRWLWKAKVHNAAVSTCNVLQRRRVLLCFEFVNYVRRSGWHRRISIACRHVMFVANLDAILPICRVVDGIGCNAVGRVSVYIARVPSLKLQSFLWSRRAPGFTTIVGITRRGEMKAFTARSHAVPTRNVSFASRVPSLFHLIFSLGSFTQPFSMPITFSPTNQQLLPTMNVGCPLYFNLPKILSGEILYHTAAFKLCPRYISGTNNINLNKTIYKSAWRSMSKFIVGVKIEFALNITLF